jgi:hypothetical protein
MSGGAALPPELELTRAAARRAIGPIKPADPSAHKNFPFGGQRTNGGRSLPPYYLVYFLLVDLLGFPNLGQFEKVAWSVPIEFDGNVFWIEHRKMGLGVFIDNHAGHEEQAEEIVKLIKKGVKEAAPFFAWLAGQAVEGSNLNVSNRSGSLFSRFEYLLGLYRTVSVEAEARANERHVETHQTAGGGTVTTTHYPAWELRDNAKWLALAAIEAFYSWTEHVFIHIAILSGKLTTGKDVADLAESEWEAKFKRALDIQQPETKAFFDKLILIRRQLRNFIAHGAFGKEGRAFRFHSGAGAVPVRLAYQSGHPRFSLGGEAAFSEPEAIETIEEFVRHLWSGEREPAYLYIQKSDLPLILTHASDGTYQHAMHSVEDMEECIEMLHYLFDQAANMDW